ncbi:hypothetical protein CTEN210_01805 [Chaetoceros tenuissimus]|uniref:Magnesium-dependent phosphatase-1 n=1 Tax=Chaetoceros tenuissimus TaxID=426638 RepID=A0AAD3H033_9STRA|nr:hypothetical protein CTEN210_01805 [Chaetoceros tenuissimus]
MTKDVCVPDTTVDKLDSADEDVLPSMIVFDLDDCLWTPEMHELYGMPSKPIRGNLNPDEEDDSSRHGRHQPKRTAKRKNVNESNSDAEIGVVGMNVPNGQTVYLYDGARRALREIATNPRFKRVLIGVASTSLEPSYSRHCINNIEIIPGLTMRDLIDYDEIGRTGHLTSRKTTHFKSLHEKSGVPYEEMVFYDDCNWGDHCQDLEDTYRVVGQRTPNGLQIEEFYAGLQKYAKLCKKR